MRSFSVWGFLMLTFMCSCSIARNGAELQRYASLNTTRNIIIMKDIDLKGQTISFPEGCSVVFKGGCIRDCQVVFNANALKGKVSFQGCTYKGTIKVNQIDDSDFTSIEDDGTLRFLISNAIANGAKCEFHRDYRININTAPGAGFVSFKDIESGADIDFHGHTVYNTTAFSTPHIQPVIALRNVKKVTIRNCIFHDADEHNARRFKKSEGCTFVYCYGDCCQINLLNCSQENGDSIMRSGIYAHNERYPENTQTIGLSNSTIIVKGLNVGYGLALYGGHNLDIDIDVDNPHRGFYCSGVSNSRISYKGYNPIETKCHILIMDSIYKINDGSGKTVLDMKGCHDLVINARIDEVLPNESIISFQTYGSDNSNGTDFSFRSTTCDHCNIDFSADIKRLPESGYFFVSRFGTNSQEGAGAIHNCVVSGITIHDVRCYEGKARPYMCHVANGIDADIIVKNCSVTDYNKEKNYGFDYYIKGNTTGKILIENSLMGSILVREKTVGEFDVVLEGTSMTRGLSFTNDNSSKKLVKLIQ